MWIAEQHSNFTIETNKNVLKQEMNSTRDRFFFKKHTKINILFETGCGVVWKFENLQRVARNTHGVVKYDKG